MCVCVCKESWFAGAVTFRTFYSNICKLNSTYDCQVLSKKETNGSTKDNLIESTLTNLI